MIPGFEGLYNFNKWLYEVSFKYCICTDSKTTLAGQLQEKCQEQNVDNMTFVDLTNAFGTVSREGLFDSHMLRFIF